MEYPIWFVLVLEVLELSKKDRFLSLLCSSRVWSNFDGVVVVQSSPDFRVLLDLGVRVKKK